MKKPTMSVLRSTNHSLAKHSLKNYRELLLALCHQNGSFDFVPSLKAAIKASDWKQVLTLADSLSAQSYADAATHFAANQFALLIRKYPWNPSLVGRDPDAKARQVWLKAERRCRLHNLRFKRMQTSYSPREDFISRVRGYIHYVLGASPDVERIYELCEYSGGASIGVHGNATNVARKLSARWSVTPSAFTDYFNAISRNMSYLAILMTRSDGHARVTCWDPDVAWDTYKAKAEVVKHNKIAFVPKTASVSRPIAVEPVGNGYIQKGIDLYMRQRLKRVGIDLSDQSRNQYFARFGSEDWESQNPFCTIDLSSASDSISLELCRMVLPHDWFVLMDRTRSKWYELDGVKNIYAKFCSMGNGFCFPLETLIFAAVCSAVGAGIPRRDFAVYGDDIIVRKEHFDDVLDGLRYLGFTPNKDKTFGSGPFRESCGADWYAGSDVRPFTLDYALDSVQNIFKFLNLTRRSDRTTAFFAGTYQMVIGWLPVSMRLARPLPGPDDSAINTSGIEHLLPTVRYRTYPVMGGSESTAFRAKTCGFSWDWWELETIPVKDRLDISGNPDMVIACILQGSSTLYVRRRTKTRIARKGGG